MRSNKTLQHALQQTVKPSPEDRQADESDHICNTLQHTATLCNTLRNKLQQHTATTRCNLLPHTATGSH